MTDESEDKWHVLCCWKFGSNIFPSPLKGTIVSLWTFYCNKIKLIVCVTFLTSYSEHSQDWPHSLWGPEQKDNAGPLFKYSWEFQCGNSKILNQVWGPSKGEVLGTVRVCNSYSFTPQSTLISLFSAFHYLIYSTIIHFSTSICSSTC